MRRHTVKGSFVWDLPDVERIGGVSKAVAVIANDWQLSGVLTAGSGAPYDVTYSYQTAGANVNLTGSPSYAARVRMVGDPGTGCSSNEYGQFDTAAFAGPTYGSLGLESGRNYLLGCSDKTLDFAIARNFSLGGSRRAQFRVDLFNAFNAVVIDNRINQLQLTSPTAPVVRNNQYNADGSLNQERLTPRTAGFGAATAAQGMRSVQIQLRFQF